MTLTLDLGRGVAVDLAFTDGRYAGLAAARLDGRPFLAAGRGCVPYCRTPDGIAYDEFHLRAQRREGTAHVLEFAALGRCAPVADDLDMFGFPLIAANAAGARVEDRLTMRVEPASEVVNGEAHRGFAVSYVWESATRRIHWLLESAALAPDGDARGSRVLAQNMTTNFCPLEVELAADTRWSTQEHYHRSCIEHPCRGGGTQLFDLVQGAGLAVATWFAEPPLAANAVRGNLQIQPGEGFATSTDVHYGPLAHRFATLPRTVVAAVRTRSGREDAVDRWSAWRAHTADRWCARLGLPRRPALPTLALDTTGAGGIDAGFADPGMLEQWTARLPWVAAQGFRAIILHTPEWVGAANRRTMVFGGNNCTPFRFQLSDQLGGEAGIKRFSDACHAHGIKVMVWIGGHLGREAPIWRQHPEWMARSADGRLWDGHYGCIHSIDLAQPAARAWVRDDLLHVRAATGVDGIWFDSFAGLTMGVVNHASPDRAPAAAGVLTLLRELAEACLEIVIEGMSPLGVSSWGNLPPEHVADHEDLLLDTSMRYQMRLWRSGAITRASYLRSLAARGPMGVWAEEFLGHPEAFPLALPAWHAPLTRAYALLVDRMHTRHLVDGGALWRDRDGRPAAFFACQDGARPPAADGPWTPMEGAEGIWRR